MANYMLTAHYQIFVEADSEEEAIIKFESELESDPVYGPFDYDIVECESPFGDD